MKSIQVDTLQTFPLPVLNLPEKINHKYIVCSWVDENYYYYGQYNKLSEATDACENNPEITRYCFRVIN